MHLTLRFLGDSEAAALAALERVLAELGTRCAPFALRLAGLGAFPNERKPRVLWVGLDGDMAALQLLQRQIEEAVQGLGWQAEQRAFRPHLTLGRVRAHQELSMSAGGDAPPDLSFAVAEVELIESRLHKRGPQYHTLYRAALMG